MISNMLRFPVSMFDEMDDWFFPQQARFAQRNDTQRGYPPINMGVTDNSVEIYLFVPDIQIKNVDITMERNLLSIEGERQLNIQDDAQSSYHQESFTGKFKRVVTLPEDVDPEKAEARYENGVLHVSIAKREEVAPRQIKVNVA